MSPRSHNESTKRIPIRSRAFLFLFLVVFLSHGIYISWSVQVRSAELTRQLGARAKELAHALSHSARVAYGGEPDATFQRMVNHLAGGRDVLLLIVGQTRKGGLSEGMVIASSNAQAVGG